MPERFKWSEPQLCTYDYDLNRPWFVYFDFEDTLTGDISRKQFRGGINAIKTKKERLLQGNALATYWKLQLQAGWNPFAAKENLPVKNPKITDAVDMILKLKKVSCGKRTIESYSYVVKLFKQWLQDNRLQDIPVDKFEPASARAYLDFLTLEKSYSNRTINDHLVILSTFCNSMIDREWLVKNPFRKIKKLQVEVGRNIAFSDDEKELLKNHLYTKDRELYYFTQFIHYCFIRRSELTRLKIENIDWHNMSIVIPSTASKNKKQESVVIPSQMVDIITEMNLQQLPPDWFIFGKRLKPGPEPYINYNHISTRHNEISKDLGISSEKGLYSWKHSGVCSLYPVLQGDIYALMRQLRHSELTTTQIYLKSLGLVDNAAIRNAVW